MNLPVIAFIVNIHKFVKHKWKGKIPKRWQNLGTWRYVTTFKHCYPNTCEILIREYGLKWEDKVIAYITKEITTPKFRRYRTRFRKVFYGTLIEYKGYLKYFMGDRRRRNTSETK